MHKVSYILTYSLLKKKKNQFSLPDIQRSFQMLKEWGTCDYGVGGVEVFY